MRPKLTQYPLIITLIIMLLILEIAKQSQIYFEFDKYLKPIVRGMLTVVVILFFRKYFSDKELFLKPVFNRVNYFMFSFFIVALLSLIIVLFQSYGLNWINAKVILRNISIGLCEEGIFRSICFGILIIKFAEKPNNIIKAAILSSLLFSLLHLMNLLDKEITTDILLSSAFQLLYSFLLGIGFAGITYKTGAIWISVFLHTIIDLYGDVDVFFPNDKRFEENTLNNMFIPILCLIIITVGTYYLFKSKTKFKTLKI